MSKGNMQFVCGNCGASFGQWFGKCPECGEWETLRNFQVSNDQFSKSRTQIQNAKFKKIAEAQTQIKNKISSGITEVDRVIGGGFASDEVILVSGEPGVGKSTLLLSIVLKSKVPVVYCSAEEDIHNVSLRAKRLGLKNETVLFTDEKQIEGILAGISELADIRPALVVFDSLQTMYTASAETLPGSFQQSKEVLIRIIEAAKREHFIALVVGHITKEGDIAGPKFLEHMVDAVLFLEGDRNSTIRILRSFKNRYGTTSETGFFSMTDSGIEEVSNPSEFFLDIKESAPGKASVGVREGARIIFATVEALAVPSTLAFPKRVAKGIDSKRFELLLAILKKHVKAPVDNYDMYVNVSGGLRINDPLADLGIAAALLSALNNKALPEKAVYIGELGLLGQLRDSRDSTHIAREAKRIGFTKIYTAAQLPRISMLYL